MGKIEEIKDKETLAELERKGVRFRTVKSKDLITKPSTLIQDQNKLRKLVNDNLKQSSSSKQEEDQEEEEEPKFIQSLFITAGLIQIFCVFQYAAHLQYHQPIQFTWHNEQLWQLIGRLTRITPATLLLVYISHKFNTTRWMQWILLITAVACGLIFPRGRFTSYNDVVTKAPGVGMFWAYALMQLDLKLALVSLALVAPSFYFDLTNRPDSVLP